MNAQGRTYVEDRVFERADFVKEPLPKSDHERCRFVRCNFAQADLSGIVFTECVFEECDLSLARLTRTAFRTVTFTGCKMLGLSFDACNAFLFAIAPTDCLMDSCSFRGMRLERMRYMNCRLHGAEFGAAKLHGALLQNCDLLNAAFEDTDLRMADLRTAFNFHIDPDANAIKGARFSQAGLGGLLGKYGIVIDP